MGVTAAQMLVKLLPSTSHTLNLMEVFRDEVSEKKNPPRTNIKIRGKRSPSTSLHQYILRAGNML